MRATLIYGAGDVRVEDVPDSTIQQPRDAIVSVLCACVFGSDTWRYRSVPATEHGRRMGHKFLDVVEETCAAVSGLRRGDLVVVPFVWAETTCDFCREGLHTSCRHGGSCARNGIDRAEGEAVRVPKAQGTLCR
ncbi:alcohol dehydrogenase catalytic domain-containing protein [Streptomyces sp. NPDC001401]|uniref:alcohol dehydrogenase catalytic domain-containing protein n=1 Tax=Streptomyces sp. NPDC001401 TaxID=3364570 RepID=UPI0036B12F29